MAAGSGGLLYAVSTPPCAGGLSHNEAERALPADFKAGANVLLQAMMSLADASA